MNDAYAAGLFDGEGYVRVARWEKPDSIHIRYQVIAGIGVTYHPVIERLQKEYGGSINQNRHDLRNKNHRIQFTWAFASQTAATFFRRVLPHLIIKRDQVKLALELQDSIDKYRHQLGHRNSFHPERDSIFAYRAKIAADIYALKKETFPALVNRGPKVSELSPTR
jgi:hypothetical protein